MDNTLLYAQCSISNESISALRASDRERPPGKVQKRFRRRGPRSNEALAVRHGAAASFRYRVAKPPGGDPCQSGSFLPACMHSFTFIHHNIRGFLSHKCELEVLLEHHNFPVLVALIETFLDASVQAPFLHGYELVGRRDRGGLK